MPTPTPSLHPHDVGLPASVVRKRKRFRRIAYIMLAVALLTAVPGWYLYGISIWGTFHIGRFTTLQAIVAYSLLIVSSITLVLGLWYLLLAQMRRLAHIVEGAGEISTTHKCPNCGWPHDYPDRFCRHCGKPLTVVKV
ncbi:MAG: zinc ribbon domain-containing protein [Planctomycetia bacterium]|nr:zinc ribbon domain-containing protein [Planctomycetia bacterium]